ncbi:hypothetical protein H1P_50028 [Hyella patelloides LEGE 07179]|uniref:Uncharacterized protein n=1 Tax=Hyella patelloides LEGE 07179 TaxID=945734 RepID=A0A563VZY3_9CYAN|nr:hypothetical protein [Hyella patelloides]VEP16823.1 hypothetical protein H1P_50028 [Hyella patelloides LEGE 07179]
MVEVDAIAQCSRRLFAHQLKALLTPAITAQANYYRVSQERANDYCSEFSAFFSPISTRIKLMTTMQIDNETTYLGLFHEAIALSQNLLTNFAFKDGVLADFRTAYGSRFDLQTTRALVNEWQNGEFDSFPEIEIVSAATINNAKGAYSVDTKKIYISKEYLLLAPNISSITSTILEEYGHHVDAEINTIDAAGDEGDIFSRLVKGQAIDSDLLEQLKAENDLAVVIIDGQKVAIEQAIGDNLMHGTAGNDTLNGGRGMMT